MLRITIDLIPFGLEKFAETLSTIEIINNGTGNKEFGNYNILHQYHDLVNDLYPPIREIKILKFRRSEGHLKLLYSALRKLINEQI